MNIMAMRLGRLYRGTPAEHALEDAVAALGVPYRVQFPGYMYGVRFFPDFFLPTLKLVLEVDDPSHDDPEKVEADAVRTATLAREWGVQVVRCTNKEALEDPHGAVQRCLASVGLWPIPSRLPLLRDSLPAPRKAPRKDRRVSRATRRESASPRHSAGRGSRSPRPPRRRAAVPAPAPQPAQAPPA